MWLLALALVAEASHPFSLALSPAESVAVTVTGTGDPLVLLPGLFGSAFGFRTLIPLLTDAGYRAIVVEPLGIGSSARPAHADYSLTAQADRIAAALDRLSVRRAIVVAHSLGASMAFRLAYRRPDLLAGIVSLDGGPCRDAFVSACHEARTLGEAVRGSETGAQKDSGTVDQSIGRLILGERDGGGRLHGGRRARPGRDAQGVPRNGGAARAGAVATTSRRGAVPRPPAPRNGDTRGRGQRGGSNGPGRRAS